MIKFDGDKMSKSLGNILYINDLLKEYDGEVLRYVLLSTHYRQPLNWSEKSLKQAKTSLDRLYRILKNNKSVLVKDVEPSKEIINALCDDINTPEAFGQLNILFNQLQNEQNDKKSDLVSQIHSSTNLLGILKKDPDEWLGYKNQTNDFDVAIIEKLINERNTFRNEKNYQESDQIRDELNSLGVEIEDTPDGTIWRKS